MNHWLEADSIRLSFGLRSLLSDIYLCCRTGEVIGLLGRNGAGKSCLMQIIYGSMPCEKSVRIDNKRIENPLRHPELVRYLPQFNFIPPDYSLRVAFDDYELDYVQFGEYFPEFKGRARARLGELSGGERRLVELYLIVWPETAFALLDEPFTHLNPLQVEKVKDLMLSVKHRKGFLITDHMFSEMDGFCNHYYVLVDGKLHKAHSNDEIADLGYIKF